MSESLSVSVTEEREGPPFVWRLLMAFLLLDGLERLSELVLFAAGLKGWIAYQPSPFAPNLYVSGLWVLVNLLLASLLILRSQAGRLWTLGIFVIHTFYLGHSLAIKFPTLWVYLGDLGRSRILLTAVVDVLAIYWLTSERAKRWLDR